MALKDWIREHSPDHPRLRRRRGESGAVAVLVAVLCLVLILLAGGAIDMSIYLLRRSQITGAMDAAVASAVSTAISSEVSGSTVSAAASAGVTAGKDLWDANTSRLGSDVLNKTLTLKVEKKATGNGNSADWVGTASLDGSYVTSFMKLAGVKTLPLKVSAGSSVALNLDQEFWEFHIMVDTSQSMGIGTTVADMEAVKKWYAENGFPQNSTCYLACHWGPNDAMSRMRTAKIDFRIDAVSRAVQSMVGTMSREMQGNAKAQLWQLYTDAKVLVPMTSTLSAITGYKIDLPYWQQSPAAKAAGDSEGTTNLRASMATLTAAVPPAGDGKTASSPKRAVFLITDGVHDSTTMEPNVVRTSPSGFHNTGPINPAFCEGLKTKGVVVSVLYLTYWIPPGTTIWHVDPFKNDILPKLKACASSPDLFFNATTPADINTSLQTMLKTVRYSGTVRLTN